MGQIICTVAADTYIHAKEAAKRVKITYDDIEPAIITIEVDHCPSSGMTGGRAYCEQNSTRGSWSKIIYVSAMLKPVLQVG